MSTIQSEIPTVNIIGRKVIWNKANKYHKEITQHFGKKWWKTQVIIANTLQSVNPTVKMYSIPEAIAEEKIQMVDSWNFAHLLPSKKSRGKTEKNKKISLISFFPNPDHCRLVVLNLQEPTDKSCSMEKKDAEPRGAYLSSQEFSADGRNKGISSRMTDNGHWGFVYRSHRKKLFLPLAHSLAGQRGESAR